MRLLAALPLKGTQAVSPHSVASALTLLALGAGGRTLEELLRVLAVGSDPEELRDLAERLRAVPLQSRPDILQAGSALWPDRRLLLRESFVSAARELLGTEVSAVDLADRPAVSERVNRWVQGATNGEIGSIITPEMVPEPPGLLLSTAFYFRGVWVDEFDPAETERAPFHAPGGDVSINLMTRSLTTWYGESSSMQAIDLSYMGGCGLLVVLPTQRSSLRQTLLQLSAPGAIDRLVDGMNTRPCLLWLPRLAIDPGTFGLSEHLRDLGATSIFTPRADFGHLSTLRTWVDGIAHRARLRLDEHGTVAAAATTGEIAAFIQRSPPPPEMRVDRPISDADPPAPYWRDPVRGDGDDTFRRVVAVGITGPAQATATGPSATGPRHGRRCGLRQWPRRSATGRAARRRRRRPRRHSSSSSRRARRCRGR